MVHPRRIVDLAEGNAAVVGRHALVPVGTKSRLEQPLYAPLRQVSVLKTATRQDDPRLPGMPRHAHDDFHERVVELRGDRVGRLAAPTSAMISSIVGRQSTMLGAVLLMSKE